MASSVAKAFYKSHAGEGVARNLPATQNRLHGPGLKEQRHPGNFQQIHESILVGSLSQIGRHEERGSYLAARNQRMSIFPGSGLAKRSPKWIVAAEIVETRRVFGRCVARVESSWIEARAQHLLRRRSSDPVWSLKRGEVVAYESVSLYGLVLADRRPVAYLSIDPVFCRDLLIREGLVAVECRTRPHFYATILSWPRK